MLVEASIITLLGLAAWRATKPSPGIMTPKMRLVYQHALNKNNPPVAPERLLELADIFEGLSLPTYADVLRKRAVLRSSPPHIKAARRAAYAKANSSMNPEVVRGAAEAFESMGMTGAAAALRNRAATLESMPVPPVASIVAAPVVKTAADQEALDELNAPVAASPSATVMPVSDPAPVASGDDEVQDFHDFMEHGGPADLIAPQVPAKANGTSNGTPPVKDEPTPAENAGMTEEEYKEFMAGNPPA